MDQLINFKQTLFTNWNFMRWLRLGFGIFMSVQAIQHHDVFAGFLATFFLFQAVTNTGCCGPSGCAVTPSPEKTNTTEVIEFEEIESTKK